MTILKPNEYDISYFDGRKGPYRHNAGYTVYEKWFRVNDDFVPHAQSTGEYWKDFALKLKLDYSLEGKVLEIGCAKGFVIEGLRDLGVDAYGIDVSQYAIDCAREDIKPHLKVADVRTDLSTYQDNEFDFLFSRWTLGSFTDEELPLMVEQMNRISNQQFHWVMETGNKKYYNLMPVQELIDKFNWKQGTIFYKGNPGEIFKK